MSTSTLQKSREKTLRTAIAIMRMRPNTRATLALTCGLVLEEVPKHEAHSLIQAFQERLVEKLNSTDPMVLMNLTA